MSIDEANALINDGWTIGNPLASNGKTKNLIWINRGESNKRIDENSLPEYILNGWCVGRVVTAKMKNGHTKTRTKLTGRISIVKNEQEKHVSKKELNSYLNDGWSINSKKRKQYKKCVDSKAGYKTRGKLHLTNGIINKMVYVDEESVLIKEGFWRGRTLKRGKN